MADQAPFGFAPGDNWFAQDQDQVAAQAAAEAAALRQRNAVKKPVKKMAAPGSLAPKVD